MQPSRTSNEMKPPYHYSKGTRRSIKATTRKTQTPPKRDDARLHETCGMPLALSSVCTTGRSRKCRMCRTSMMSGSQAERSWRFIRRLEYYSSPPQERRKPSASLNWAYPLRQALLTIELVPPPFENRANMRRICHTLAALLVCVGLLCIASGFVFDYLHPEYVSSFPSYLYLLRAVPLLIAAGVVETVFFLLKRKNEGKRDTDNSPNRS